MTLFDRLQQEFPFLDLRKVEPLSKHTSFRIGGPAPMAFPKSAEMLTELYRFCLKQNVQPLILGAGTNILAPDQGLDRLVICTKGLNRIQDLGNGVLEAEAGVPLAKLACFARDRGLSGLEFAHGIPGTVGGGVYMNAGAYGGEMKQVATYAEGLLQDGSVLTAEGKSLGFSYRNSVFQKQSAVILRVRFCLKSGDPAAIGAEMQELMEKRRASQPLELPSAGSTFKRPADGYAAVLIEEAGLKGKRVGQAAVSEKHAGFVVNLGGATAEDVLAVMAMVKQCVWEHSGVELEPEVRIW